jgi:hypothetical protein
MSDSTLHTAETVIDNVRRKGKGLIPDNHLEELLSEVRGLAYRFESAIASGPSEDESDEDD